MTVAELIKALEPYAPDAPVFIEAVSLVDRTETLSEPYDVKPELEVDMSEASAYIYTLEIDENAIREDA